MNPLKEDVLLYVCSNSCGVGRIVRESTVVRKIPIEKWLSWFSNRIVVGIFVFANETSTRTMNYKIAVLGPIPRDHITTHKGMVVTKYGCITHPVIALSKLSNGQASIYPVAHVRRIDREPILELFGSYPGIHLDGVTSHSDMGDVIRLKFVDQNNRLEKQLAFMDPIVPDDVKDLVDCDAFVFVPITDFEISLDTLRYLRQHSKGTIIFDAHGPTNTMTRSGDRHLKFWVDRDLWLPYIDVLKMNIEESTCCWFEKEYELDQLTSEEAPGRDHLLPFATHCLSKGVRAVIITVDEHGCLVFFREGGEVREVFVPSVKVDQVVDTTGAGDSFAGGLAFGLLRHPGDFVQAARYANALGSQRTQGTTFEVFKSLEETEAQIARNYGL